MASKSIQILVNEFPAAAGSSVVAVASAAGGGITVEICEEAGRIALIASTLHLFNASTRVPSGLLLDLMQ